VGSGALVPLQSKNSINLIRRARGGGALGGWLAAKSPVAFDGGAE
jgi:hypothetical protein